MKEVTGKLFYKKNVGYVYISNKIVLDSSYPFPREKCDVTIEIAGDSIVVSPVKEKKQGG